MAVHNRSLSGIEDPLDGPRINAFQLTDGDQVFDTGRLIPSLPPPFVFTLEDTAGCSCGQIIAELGLGPLHSRFGCGLLAMLYWVEQVSP